METFEVNTQWSHNPNCILTLGRYQNNDHIAVSVYSLDEGPFANITVNIDSTDSQPKNFGFVDTNNFPEAEAIIEKLKIGRKTGQYGASGFCMYPLYEFDEKAIKKYVFDRRKR